MNAEAVCGKERRDRQVSNSFVVMVSVFVFLC